MIWAAIGTDGTQPVVWGLGSSPAEAEADARYWADQGKCEPGLTRFVQVSAEVAARINDGEVSVAALGLEASHA